MIPKIIHQIWLGDQSKKPEKLMNTWKEKNPSWEYMFWDESNLPTLTNQRNFDNMTEYCGKADILRYEILHRFGGFFIDADSESVKPLEDWLLNCDSFACYESEQHRPGLIANGYLASVKECKLMALLIQAINKTPNINANRPWRMTGPLLLTNIRQHHNYPLMVHPSHYFIPKHYLSNAKEYVGEDHVFAKQYWGTTNKVYGKI